MGRPKLVFACALLSAVLSCLSARAQSGDELPPALVARIRLANALYDQGNLVAALAEYRRIQLESGKAPARFNIGKICAELNRPVESVAELNLLLASPGNTPADRLSEAQRLRDEQQARIGKLQIKTRIPATIEIDNLAVGETSVKVVADLPEDATVASLGAGAGTSYWLKQPVELGNGVHYVAALAPGHAPLRLQVDIAGRVAKEIELPLQPAKAELASIRVKTNLPGADLLLDDVVIGRTPLPVTLPVEAGVHKLAFRRTGYRTVNLERDLVPGQVWEVDAALEEDAYDSSAAPGQLALEDSEPGAQVTIDGKVRNASSGVVRLPPGPHDVEISHSQFLPYRAQVDIESGRTRKLRVAMEPTAEVRHRKLKQASGQRWRAWTTLAAGAILTGGGAWYLRSALSERDQANRDFADVQAQFSTGGVCDPMANRDVKTAAACEAKRDRANSEVSTADHKVLGGYIATGVGAAALVTGVILVLTIDDTSRYERYRDEGTASVAWLGWANPTGGGVALAGRF